MGTAVLQRRAWSQAIKYCTQDGQGQCFRPNLTVRLAAPSIYQQRYLVPVWVRGKAKIEGPSLW